LNQAVINGEAMTNIAEELCFASAPSLNGARRMR
jgi:hypothetical protein